MFVLFPGRMVECWRRRVYRLCFRFRVRGGGIVELFGVLSRDLLVAQRNIML